jgi:hypothetical protein
MKKILPPLLFCILLFSLISTVSASTYSFTVTTDSSTIFRFFDLTISGTLAKDGSPFSSSLLAIQIKSPDEGNLALRTVNTGANPAGSPIVQVNSVFHCDSNGNPTSDVQKGVLAYYRITVYNNAYEPKPLVTALSLYDNENVLLASKTAESTIAARSTTTYTWSMPIPSWAASGRALAYASAYRAFPEEWGTPYCPEQYHVFTIGGIQGANPQITGNGNQGNYNLNFKIPPKCMLGTYYVRASAAPDGLTQTASTLFDVKQLGDFDDNGTVDLNDITSFIDAYIAYWQELPYDERADFDSNESVDLNDITAFIDAYIVYWRT